MEKDRTIMIVDDDRACRDMYKDLLYCISPNLKVIQARNGKEAADKLEELAQISSLPNTVMTDFEMPVMNGFDLLKFIRNHSDPLIKTLHVVMISGNCSEQLRTNVENLGCQLFQKPADMDEVCSALLKE
ncbi:MAG: response regulator [bacterium]|nr:response regulator [bacterium]